MPQNIHQPSFTHFLAYNPGNPQKLSKKRCTAKTVQRFVCASGGTRTHKPVRASDFKSDAYANSATEAAINYYAIHHCKEQAGAWRKHKHTLTKHSSNMQLHQTLAKNTQLSVLNQAVCAPNQA